MELAAKPTLLFLDEPTSGLDSQTAWSIATLIRKLSDSGMAVLCTIHQPSALLFQQFDRVLLLAKGGRTVYFGDLGDECRTLIKYFESRGAPVCEPHVNPAEWMLTAIGAAPGSKTDQDWPTLWRHSDECESIQRGLADLEDHFQTLAGQRQDHENELSSSKTYASTFYVQMLACLQRVFQQYWRTPSYIYAKLILSGGIVSHLPLILHNLANDHSFSGPLHRCLFLRCRTIHAGSAEPNVRHFHAPRRFCISRLSNHAQLYPPERSIRSQRAFIKHVFLVGVHAVQYHRRAAVELAGWTDHVFVLLLPRRHAPKCRSD